MGEHLIDLTGRAGLFVGHPGHELCVHGWLERVRPTVFVLTDGGGREGRSRLESTTRLLQACGATPCQPFGRFSDEAVYQSLLRYHHQPLVDTAAELADALERLGLRYLVCDPLDGYNPSHDACRALAGAALEMVRRRTGRRISAFEAALTTIAGRTPEADWVQLALTEAELQRKHAAALGYTELRDEIDAALARGGPEVFRTEWLLPMRDPLAWTHPASAVPYYETYGLRQVAARRYSETVRYREHMAPFLASLKRRLEDGLSCAA
jgi:hypothetical protein